MQLSRSKREAEAFEQPKRAPILALQHGSDAVDAIMLGKLGHHGLNRLSRNTAAPIRAGQFVRNSGATIRVHGCLHIANKV